MPQVLTTNALITCPHGGKGTTAPLHPKWTVSGGFVAVGGDAGVLSCTFWPLPCVGYTLQSMGLNATEIDGRKVVLVTDFNQTFTKLPLVMAEFHQTLDESTPAPLSPGQSASLPPELTDYAKPVVATNLPYIAVPLTPPPPAPVAISFTLTTQYPLRWILTLVDEPHGASVELTNGWPGALIAPVGGAWYAPTQVVDIALPIPFVATLAPGKHHLYMTGVSKRGLSGNAEAVIEVFP